VGSSKALFGNILLREHALSRNDDLQSFDHTILRASNNANILLFLSGLDTRVLVEALLPFRAKEWKMTLEGLPSGKYLYRSIEFLEPL
jgi:hypothetical protein